MSWVIEYLQRMSTRNPVIAHVYAHGDLKRVEGIEVPAERRRAHRRDENSA